MSPQKDPSGNYIIIRYTLFLALVVFIAFDTATDKSLQSCPALCNPMDCSLPGSSVHGIFQARVLEWGAIYYYQTLYDGGFPGGTSGKEPACKRHGFDP